MKGSLGKISPHVISTASPKPISTTRQRYALRVAGIRNSLGGRGALCDKPRHDCAVAALAILVLLGVAAWVVPNLLGRLAARRADAVAFRSRRPRNMSPGRARTQLCTVLVGWTGVCFVAAWWIVRHPDNNAGRGARGLVNSVDVPLQPAPSWLWQLGIALAVVGLVCLVLLAVTTPFAAEGAPPARDASQPLRLNTIAAGMLVGMLIAGATTSAVATSSSLRWEPLVVAAGVTVFMPPILLLLRRRMQRG